MTAARKSSYRFGPFRLDGREQRLSGEGRVVPLTPKVFDVLRVLVENSGHLVEKDALLKQVWQDSFVEEGALNRTISVLRKALAEHDSSQQYIETVPKRGYRFVAPVADCGVEGEAPRLDEPPVGVVVHPARPLLIRSAVVLAAIAGVLLAGGGSLALLWRAGTEQGTQALQSTVHRQVTFTGKEGAPTISPDGRRIAYVTNEKLEKRLVVQELAGGHPLEIFAAPEIGYLHWSPDGSDLLLWTRGAGRNGVYIMPQLGGTPRQIVAGQFISCWSPDGSVVAIATYLVGKILLFDSRGRAQRTLTLRGDHWSIWDIDWSASGDRLVFVSSDQQGRYTIFTIRSDGSDQKTILSGRAEIPSVRWAPQGDAIYYFQRVNQTVSLHRVRVDAGPAAAGIAGRTLVTGLETDRFFALSADAKRLVYARAPYYSNLWMLDAATGRTLELTRGTSLIERPRVSPDGRSLVFNVGHEPFTNLSTMPITGGLSRQLTFLNALNVGGVWSADGTRIAFGSSHGDQPRIWTVAAAGGTPRALATREVSDNLDVVWAPGARILYQRAGNRNYSEMDPQTATERLLVKDGSPGWMFAPVYSPDSRKVAVMWNRPPTRGVWVIDIDGNDRREALVYPSTAPSARPIGWSADGAWIYVVEGKGGIFRGATSFTGETMTEATILRVASKGGAVATVAALPPEEIGSVTMTPDGRRFVYPVFSSRSDIWVVDDFDVPPTVRQ